MTKSVLGIKVEFKVPTFVAEQLKIVDNQSIGNIIREGMRTAAKPSAAALKVLIRTQMNSSSLSTGATERSIDVKYGRSKRDPRRFYCIIGVNKSHIELHTSAIPEGIKTKKRKGKSLRGVGLFGLQTRKQKNGTMVSRQVFSSFKDRRRANQSRVKPIKRIPKKYFHLIDLGFMHYRAGYVRGYNFISRLQESLYDSMQVTFENRLHTLIIPTIKRELIRKWRNVLK